jgi:ureidoglycolate lyase
MTRQDRIVTATPLTRKDFDPFGEVIETQGAHSYPINEGKCTRFHDLAKIEAAGANARVLISIFRGSPYDLPLSLRLVERHPLGSQAFYPLGGKPYLVIVCHGGRDGPGRPQAFVARPDQGVNYARNVWHAVLTPFGEGQDFLVVDRGGDGTNLEEFHFSEPWEVVVP